MENPQELREKAVRYRQLAASFSDQQTITALIELAAELEARANIIEANADQKNTDNREH